MTTAVKPYAISLTDNEIAALGWAVNRGYFPKEAYDGLTLQDGQPEESELHRNLERVWELSEPAAWSIKEMANDDPHAYLTCIGGELLAKLRKLEDQIV